MMPNLYDKMTMPNLYDVLATGGSVDRVLAALTPADAVRLMASWSFWARPGQHWTPGLERITDIECGRGWGKNYASGQTICDAAEDPERWGGHAAMFGPEPTQTKALCIIGESGVLAAAKRRADAGVGLGVRRTNFNDRFLQFEAPRGGGGGGLTVHWGASSDPKSARGLTLGLSVCDEFAVWYHCKTDEAGANLWKVIEGTMRGGPSPKYIITQTPSRAPEVRALQRDAERPECRVCREAHVAAHGPYDGEVGKEPWRLPSSEQRRVHPRLETRTTVVVRVCPTCGAEVIADVRAIYGATTDNPMTAADFRAQAKRAVDSGSSHGRLEYSPRGEMDADTAGALVREEDVRKVDVPDPGRTPDRWAFVLNFLSATEVVVFVDPAVTATEDSDDSGVGVACLRHVPEAPVDSAPSNAGPRPRHQQVVGLEDASVSWREVTGPAPSATWAPRAYWLALLWGARRVIVETNQGGEEAVAAVRALVSRPPTEQEAAARLAELTGLPPSALNLVARRVVATARALSVETVARAAGKEARWAWYGGLACRGEQAVACLPWRSLRPAAQPSAVQARPGTSPPSGAAAWRPIFAQLTVPAVELKRRGERRDRADWLIAAGQVLTGARESRGRVSDPQAGSWMGAVRVGNNTR